MTFRNRALALVPGTWKSRLAAVALLALVLGPVMAMAIHGAIGVEQAIDRAATQRAQQDLVLARRPGLLAALARQAPPAPEDYLHAETEGLAGADLQGRLATLAERHSAQILSLQVMERQPDEEQSALRRVAVQVHLTCNHRALRDLLYELESGRPLLVVDGLTISAPTSDASGLDVAFTVTGYLDMGG